MLLEMSPKWAKKAHFGDISYIVFNRRKFSYAGNPIFYYIMLDGSLQ